MCVCGCVVGNPKCDHNIPVATESQMDLSANHETQKRKRKRKRKRKEEEEEN